MTQYSYSRVSLFEDCPYHFKLRYIDKLTELPKFEDAANPLIIGHALHTGIEHDVQTALDEYLNAFPVITDQMIEEAIKLEILIPKVKKYLADNFNGCELIHEYELDTPDFKGFVDLIVKAPDGKCAVIDFKYSNNIKNYMDSGQLHIYKDYLEKEGFIVEKLAYLFVPKTSIRLKKSEDQYQFRKRIVHEVSKSEVTFVPIKYDEMQLVYFLNNIKKIESAKEYPKNTSGNCFSCNPRFAPDYLEIITNYEGEMIMQLPSSERRNIEEITKRVFWLYGAPFSGKTTFTNEFPNPLMLNTDGNIRFVDAPYISIANEVTTTGRVTNTKLAWDIFKDTIGELEKKNNDFQTIIVDLLEDTYEACRIYMYDKLNIEHEADNSFKAWDMVRTEFLSTMKRVVHLDYENIIFLSHEDISKDVTKKTGDKITAIKPNLQDKAALKIAGMVDIVGRVVADDDERRIIFKSKDYVFGGGRLPKLPVSEIDLNLDQLFDVYEQANKNAQGDKKSPRKERTNDNEDTAPKRERSSRKRSEEKTQNDESSTENEENNPDEEKPKRERKRRERNAEPTEEDKPRERKRRERTPVADDETPPGEGEPPAEETTSRRRRTRR